MTTGERRRPDWGPSLAGPPTVKEGAAAEDAVRQAARRTTSRRELARHPRFDEVSPEVGELDEAAFDDAAGRATPTRRWRCSPTSPAPPTERSGSWPAAGRRGRARRRPAGRAARRGAGVDATVAVPARRRRPRPRRQPRAAGRWPRASGAAVDLDDLRVRAWVAPGTALCLLVDRSGSMGGRAAGRRPRWPRPRSPGARPTTTACSPSRRRRRRQGPGRRAARRAGRDDLLALRGLGTTDLARALRLAGGAARPVARRPPDGGAAVGLPGHRARRRRGAPRGPRRARGSWRPPATPTRPGRWPATSAPASRPSPVRPPCRGVRPAPRRLARVSDRSGRRVA